MVMPSSRAALSALEAFCQELVLRPQRSGKSVLPSLSRRIMQGRPFSSRMPWSISVARRTAVPMSVS